MLGESLFMELILINQQKMKIMLSAPDMQHYELNTLTLGNMSYLDDFSKNAFRHIINDAKAQSGFCIDGKRLLVQIYTSKCGGCEIFITKLDDNEAVEEDFEESSIFDTPLTEKEMALIKKALSVSEEYDDFDDEPEEDMKPKNYPISSYSKEEDDQPENRTVRVILRTEGLEVLLSVCRRLLCMGYIGKSSAYIEEDRAHRTYYLRLEVPDGIFYLLPDSYAFLKEYGEVSRLKHLELYLSEHSHILCADRAIETLGAL